MVELASLVEVRFIEPRVVVAQYEVEKAIGIKRPGLLRLK